MRVELSYGRDGIAAEIADELEVRVIRKPEMPPVADPPGAVQAAFAKPVAGPPLAELARGRRSACILICDITRPVPNRLFLQPLIRQLLDAGLQAADITVLVATGLHRPAEDPELAELVGDPWVLDTVKVENHFARNDADHVELGETPTRGTRIRLDRRFVAADLKIATGLVEPHFMAGYSGGRKVIAPGVAHAETITTFHSARFMEHPLAANCVLEGNPLHEEQLEVVKMLGGAWALNTVINEARELAFVNFGEIVASHAEAVAFARRFVEVPIDRRYATILTSAAGYPLDKTYYQTIKGMVAPMDILAPGGDLIVASECSEGMGSPHFVEAQRRFVSQGPERFLEALWAKSHADIDEWQTEMQLKPMRVGSIHLYSGALAEADRPLTGVNIVPDLGEAVMQSVARTGERHIAVIPEGPYVVPLYRPAA